MGDRERDTLSAVFGASGTLGDAISSRLEVSGRVARMTRSKPADSNWTSTSESNWIAPFAEVRFERVVWAQGANASGAIGSEAASDDLRGLFDANVAYIVETLEALMSAGAVSSGSSLCIVSSVWQLFARDSKLAYVTSKAAVGGLVRSLAADLGPQGIRVNAILPGVVHSPMTSRFLDAASIERIAQETPMKNLVTVADVAEAVCWVTGPQSGGIHGQSIPVDNGWSVVRSV